MSQALAIAGTSDEDETLEDEINCLMEAKKLLPNASYFASTATPKNKTLEIFGEPDPQPDGTVRHRPFHSYTMKRAIQEGFILDVLRYYTPVPSYYKLAHSESGRSEAPSRDGASTDLRRCKSSSDVRTRIVRGGSPADQLNEGHEWATGDVEGGAVAVRRNFADHCSAQPAVAQHQPHEAEEWASRIGPVGLFGSSRPDGATHRRQLPRSGYPARMSQATGVHTARWSRVTANAP